MYTPLPREEHKLVLLYLLKQAQMPLTGDQLTWITLGQGWMTYFDLQLTLQELRAADLLAYSPPQYAPTPQGLETIRQLQNMLPDFLIRQIDGALDEHRLALKREGEVVAEYEHAPDGQHQAHLMILEAGKPIFDARLTFPSAQTARAAARAFGRDASSVYGALVASLLVNMDGDGDA